MRNPLALLTFAILCQAQESATFGTTVTVPGGLTGTIYFIPPVSSLPDLSKLKPVGTIYTKTLNVPGTEFRNGFPGVTDRFEWFAIDYRGRIYVSYPGNYRFHLVSDDGAGLFIDGRMVIQNGGEGVWDRETVVKLSGGIHEIRVNYFQGPRYHLALVLTVMRPGDPKFRIFNTDDFAPPSDLKDWKFPVPSDWQPTTPTTTADEGPRPPIAEQTALIQRASVKAAAYNSHLPDFLCTQIVNRAENVRSRGWKPMDVLTLQLSYVNRLEHYKLIAIDSKPSNTDFEKLGGSLSEGEFGSILAEIFQPRTAQFVWSHQEVLRDRTVDVFDYKIVESRSDYWLQYESKTVRQTKIRVAHHGKVYIDPVTAEVLRVDRIADIPANFPITEASTTIDYGPVTVAGQSYLLPLLATASLNTRWQDSQNEIHFLDYRKFEADATISFTDKP